MQLLPDGAHVPACQFAIKHLCNILPGEVGKAVIA